MFSQLKITVMTGQVVLNFNIRGDADLFPVDTEATGRQLNQTYNTKRFIRPEVYTLAERTIEERVRAGVRIRAACERWNSTHVSSIPKNRFRSRIRRRQAT